MGKLCVDSSTPVAEMALLRMMARSNAFYAVQLIGHHKRNKTPSREQAGRRGA